MTGYPTGTSTAAVVASSSWATAVNCFMLAGDVPMPSVGMGLYQIDPAQMTPVVHAALGSGYRLFDTASMYNNETEFGKAIRSCGMPRSEMFITTKLWNDEQGRDKVRKAVDRSLLRLRTDYLDLYLIHWPVPGQGLYVETWETLLELQREGRIRAAGVANFEPDHIHRLITSTGIAPAVNQIEVHPQLQQTEVVAYNASVGTVTQAWSPLARGGTVLTDPVIMQMAHAHDRTAGQVILRWHLQGGITVVPKSSSLQRISENIDLFSFSLSDAEMHAIAGLESGNRTGPDPRTFPSVDHPSTL